MDTRSEQVNLRLAPAVKDVLAALQEYYKQSQSSTVTLALLAHARELNIDVKKPRKLGNNR